MLHIGMRCYIFIYILPCVLFLHQEWCLMMSTLPLSLQWKVSVRVWLCSWWSSMSGRLIYIPFVLFSHVLTFVTKRASSQTCLCLSCVRLSMIEPGPVHTEFETKMMENVARMDFPGVDADTVRYFKDVYLPSSTDIFEAMGQTPEDIAKVRKRLI